MHTWVVNNVWKLYDYFASYIISLFIAFVSTSWVSNGVVGSPAFAAFDQGHLFIPLSLYG